MNKKPSMISPERTMSRRNAGKRGNTGHQENKADFSLRDVRLAKRGIWPTATLVGFMAGNFTVPGFLIRLPGPAS